MSVIASLCEEKKPVNVLCTSCVNAIWSTPGNENGKVYLNGYCSFMSLSVYRSDQPAELLNCTAYQLEQSL